MNLSMKISFGFSSPEGATDCDPALLHLDRKKAGLEHHPSPDQ
jgi:hypothetical protein